ncbi:integral membrane protein [Streptococcus pneumoniae]|nr:integral membrane protein [Streptococcus pneumoniae]
MSISQRTTKLILATCLACLLAYFLNLSSAVSAGIIALLSLSDTRRSTLKLARNRLFSMLLALAIGVLAFHLSGFHIWSLGLYLAFYVPLAYKMGWEIGITPSTVLVSHLLVQESTSPDLLVNEFLLFAIGTGFALLVNLYMPSREEEIQHYHTAGGRKVKRYPPALQILFIQRRRTQPSTAGSRIRHAFERSPQTGLFGSL